MIKNRVVIQRIVVWIVFMIGLKTQASIVEARYDLDDGLKRILQTVRTNGWVDLIKSSYVIGDSSKSSKDMNNNKAKLDFFVENLIDMRFDTIAVRDRMYAIRQVYELIAMTSRYYPTTSDKERWSIRLKALAWGKQQLDRLLASPPEDNRPWPEKWRNPRAPYDSEKGQWDEAVSRLKSRFYRSDLRMCVQAAEDDRYSEEFRAWCFKEIERIIGRPLTDDDIMFKDDVLKRRAKRKKAQEGKE